MFITFWTTRLKLQQSFSLALSALLIVSGLIALPLIGNTTGTGIATGKYGSDQVFSTPGLVAQSTCTSGTPNTFASFTVQRSGLSNPVTMTNNRYVSFFESADSNNPWGAKLFESDGTELRLNGSDWISSATATSQAVSFDTLRIFSPAGKIYALSDEGFVYSGTDIGELVISNSEPFTTSLTITPTEALNDCTSGFAIGKLTALQSTYSANPNVNQSINQAPASSATLVRTIGNFGLNQEIVPITMKATGNGTYTYTQTGTLPTGITFDTNRGVLSGKPTQAGSFNFTITISESGTEVDSKTYTGEVFNNVVLDNTALRFGNGNQHSVNSVGLFEQPFYRSPISRTYKQLTYSNYALDMAIGTGTRSGWPSSNVVDITSAPRVNPQYLDYRDYVSTSGTGGTSKGYGKITVITTFTINSQTIEVKNVYSLGQTDKFVKIETTSTNKSGSQVANLHVWVGTKDDWVGDSDGPTKLKGNLDGPNGSFNGITNAATEARALQITTDAEGALFYSTTPGTNMSIAGCCRFSNAYNVNPTTSPITLTGDGSYSAMLPVGTIQNNESATITWFYAAGALADLDAVAQAVAAAAAPPPPVVTRSNTSATISWDEPEVEAGATIIGYNYRYSTNNGLSWTTSRDLPATPRTTTIDGLDNTQSFIFQVRAITQVGSDASTRANGSWSGSSEAEVLGAPQIPTLNSVTGSDGSLIVAFTPPASPISPITYYEYCLSDCNTSSNWKFFYDNSSPPVATIPSSPVTISPVANGSTYQVQIRAGNIHGASNPSDAVSAVTKPVWATSTLTAIYKGTSYTMNLSAAASVTSYSIVSGALPTGLSLGAANGRISGTATVGGPYTVTIRATNAGGSADKTFTGTVTPHWTPTGSTLNATTTAALDVSLDLASAQLSSLSSGATVSVTGVPTGVSFTVSRTSQAGVIPTVTLSGTPAAVGTYTIRVTITDSAGRTTFADFTLEVTAGSTGSGSITPSPSATPGVNPTDSSRPTPRPSLVPVLPTPQPGPLLSPTAPLLIPELTPIPNASFGPSNPIPQQILDFLSRPLAYVLDALNDAPELPELAPTESLAYENGEPVVIELVKTDSENGYVLRGDGWEIALEATDSSGAPLLLDDSGNIILNTDRFVQFSGSGFAPGSIVKVWLFSDPAELSDVVADASGNFVGQAQLPEGIPTGEHTVQLNGLTQDGQLRSVSLGVLVQPDPVAALPAPIGFDLSGLMNFLWLLATGVLIFFFILWRRRRKKEKEQGQIPSGSADTDGDLIFASEGFATTPLFPDDSRRKIGPASPPNRRRFTFKPKNT